MQRRFPATLALCAAFTERPVCAAARRHKQNPGSVPKLGPLS